MGMADKALNLLSQFVPIGFAVKGLESLDPRFKKFFGTGIAAGYGTNELLGYLRSKFQTEGEKANKSQLQERVASGMARPEERAGLSEIEHAEAPGDVLQTAGALGAGALAGAGAAGLLGKGAQAATAMQGLKQKVGQAATPVTQAYKAQEGLATPVIAGRAIAQAQQAPHRLQAALKAKNGPQTALQTTQAAQAVPTALDMLKRNNPEIGAFFESEIKKGKDPLTAAAKAREKPSLKTPIMEMEAENELPFEGIIAHIFGGNVPQEQEITPTQTIPANSPQLTEVLNLIRATNQAKGIR